MVTFNGFQKKYGNEIRTQSKLREGGLAIADISLFQLYKKGIKNVDGGRGLKIENSADIM